MEADGWGRTGESFYFYFILLNHTFGLFIYLRICKSFPMCNALGAVVERDTYVSANAIWINGGI